MSDIDDWDQIHGVQGRRMSKAELVDEINSVIAANEAFIIQVAVGEVRYSFKILDAPHRRFSRLTTRAFR